MKRSKEKKLLMVDPLCNRHVAPAQERNSTLFIIDATHARGKVLRASMRIDVERIALIS